MTKGITPEQLARVESGKKGFSDPCVICGNTFDGADCTHTAAETEVIFKMVKRMTRTAKDELRSKVSTS